MRVGVISAFMDYHRRGARSRGVLQPLIGSYIGSLLPPHVEVEAINETWREPDWNRDYDLLFLSSMHSDFDRARQISHYWRRRGAKTVYGGNMASTYPRLCQPFFDAVVVGDPEGSVPQIYRDFEAGELAPLYLSTPYEGERVPTPRFDLLVSQQRVPLSLEATRGCPFQCDFCALTALGTRFHRRPIENVIQDIRRGQETLRSGLSRFQKRMVSFVDNNLGGDPRWLLELCEALVPLKIRWGTALTFNVVTRHENVVALSRSGCRFLFMGLESFNPETLQDMNKRQNAVDQTRRVLEDCRRHGIVVVGGMMLSPLQDDLAYVASIPERLRECGLHMPTFVCFECPIPGTPHFERLAAEPSPALLPNALLEDFNGYTLVVRPRKASVADFVAAYRQVLDQVYNGRTKLRKWLDDMRHFAGGGYWTSALVDTVQLFSRTGGSDPGRTYVAGTEIPMPERRTVPLSDADFSSEEERRSILEPWRVTDETGAVLPAWRTATKLYHRAGELSPQILDLVANEPAAHACAS